jgi:hypothetical protein
MPLLRTVSEEEAYRLFYGSNFLHIVRVIFMIVTDSTIQWTNYRPVNYVPIAVSICNP